MPTVSGFVVDLRAGDLPEDVRRRARQCLLDTLGVGYAGSRLPIGPIVYRFAAGHLAAGGRLAARMIGDGRRVGVPGAALAGAAVTDAYDAHDGHVLCQGHAGVSVVPTALAFADALALDDFDELACRIAVGYEIGTRAGIALHSDAAVHHSSGAWNALAAAAVGARSLGLPPQLIEHALGIAEYYGPRSPLMRVAVRPTMLKDGSTMGAFAGATAALLAADGFTGAPAETTGPPYAEVWADLGSRWRILEHYVKSAPVCRWTEPAIAAALDLRERFGLRAEAVRGVRVDTFAAAVSLGCREPDGTDAAQYSLPFVVAAALVHGRVGFDQVAGAGLTDPEVLALSRTVQMRTDPELDARFPEQRWARVRVTLADGAKLDSGQHTTLGDPGRPLPDGAWEAKFLANAEMLLAPERAGALLATGQDGEDLPTFLDTALRAGAG